MNVNENVTWQFLSVLAVAQVVQQSSSDYKVAGSVSGLEVSLGKILNPKVLLMLCHHSAWVYVWIENASDEQVTPCKSSLPVVYGCVWMGKWWLIQGVKHFACQDDKTSTIQSAGHIQFTAD